MSSYDEYLKELVRLAPHDFLSIFFPEENTENWKVSPQKVEFQVTTKLPDFLLQVQTHQGETFLLHVEFQLKSNPEFPFRLTTYGAVIEEKMRIPVYSGVFFLEDTKGAREFPEILRSEVMGKEVRRTYCAKFVIGEWKGEEMVEKAPPALLPLLSLMKLEEGREEELFRRALKKILEVGDREQKELYLLVFYTFGGYRYPDLTETLMEEEAMKDLMESATYRKIIEKGIQQGIEKGIQQEKSKSRQESILRILKARFGEVGEEISSKVKRIRDLKKLDSLIDLAATCESLGGFEKGL